MRHAPTRALRILLVGLGPLGRKVVADLVARDAGDELVGAVDLDPALDGKPLAELVPQAAGSDVRVESDLARALAAHAADCAIVTTVSDLAVCAPTLRTLLGAGFAVASTCEELAWPWLRHPELAEELDRLARDHGARLLGTGVNPGFLMDVFPLFATAVCRTVHAVRVTRVQDASSRRIPFQRKIGAGLDDAEFATRVASRRLRHVGLGESMHLLAHGLAVPLERWDEALEPVRALRDLECDLGAIPAGGIAGVEQIARGFVADADEPVLTLSFRAAIGQTDPHDRVEVDGDPPVDLVWRGGVHGDVATTSVLLSTIRPLLDGPPGLHTMASIRAPAGPFRPR